MNQSEINKEFFKKLIERYLEGITTADEVKLLVNYYESFQKNNEWVEALGPEHIIKKRMLRNILEAINEEDSKQTKVITLWKNNIFKYGVAASIILLLGFYLVIKNTSFNVIPNAVVNTSIEVGTNKAILTREDGSNIALEKGANYTSEAITSNGEELIYSQENSTSKEIAYNYLTIPRGGEFFVNLADGTKVWLNSESKLKYPVSFISGQSRKVELLYGEAYFDVSPSTQHQGAKFLVTNNNHEIEVLGTEFNIKAYHDEDNVTTTLVEGKVNINYQGNSHILLPNQQSVLNRVTNSIEFKEVDVYNEVAWKSGLFVFDNKSLKDIMTVLARWYDFEVVFKNETVQNEIFVGTLGKNDKIEDILLNLKDLGIINDFEFDKKKITIE